MTGAGYGGPEGHLEAISGPVWGVHSGVILGPFWVHSEVISRPYLGNLIEIPEISFIWP